MINKGLFVVCLKKHSIVSEFPPSFEKFNLNEVDNKFDKTVDVLILVEKIKVINTKKGDKMAFLTGSDETATKEFTMFPKVFNNYQEISKGDLLKIRGHVEKRLDEIQIIVEKVKYLQGEEHE